jgi:hypothetical protein
MSYRFQLSIIIAIVAIVFFSQCEKDPDPNVSFINFPEGNGFALLSEYNFFTGELADLTPNTAAGVLPYDLNMTLFSDYASKKRFIYLKSVEILFTKKG